MRSVKTPLPPAPPLVHFSDPEFAAMPGLDARKVRAGLDASKAELAAPGYDAELCLADFGETAAAVVEEALERKAHDCVVVGAGVRKPDRHFLLFERPVNVVHEHAPRARLCFNTRPDDTAEAVRRWV